MEVTSKEENKNRYMGSCDNFMRYRARNFLQLLIYLSYTGVCSPEMNIGESLIFFDVHYP
jgi:hypothetical protein